MFEKDSLVPYVIEQSARGERSLLKKQKMVILTT